MGTKKEMDIKKVTGLNDNDYIRAITSSGESVQISKKDLAQAISEVLPRMPGSMTAIQNINDLDTVHTELDAGLYYFRVLGNTLNTPVSSGALLHLQRYEGTALTSSLMILQIFHNPTSIRYRIGAGDGTEIIFKDWIRLF